MKQCWHKKQDKRPTFDEILKRLIAIRPQVVIHSDTVGKSPLDLRRKSADSDDRPPAADLVDVSDSSREPMREFLKISESESNKADSADMEETQRRVTTPAMPGSLYFSFPISFDPFLYLYISVSSPPLVPSH